MGVQIFDDGSTITTDDVGNVTGVTNNQGTPVAVAGADGSGIVRQFANLLNAWGNAAINAKYVQPTRTTAAAAQTSNVSTLLIVGALAFVAYHTLAK